jgi:hypothetical protein
MTQVELRELLHDRLAPLFPGFEPSKKEEGFVRKFDGGKQTVGVSLVDRWPLFLKFSLVLSVRLEAVQAIFNQFGGGPPKYFAITTTSATLLDYFFEGTEQKKEFEVRDEVEIEMAMLELTPVVRDRILPFLDEYRTVDALNRGMNFGNEKFDRLNEPYRSMSALTVARLAKEPRFPELVARYRERVATCQAHDREKLAKLIAHLETLPI